MHSAVITERQGGVTPPPSAVAEHHPPDRWVGRTDPSTSSVYTMWWWSGKDTATANTQDGVSGKGHTMKSQQRQKTANNMTLVGSMF